MVQALTDRLGLYVQAYTLYSSVRPFGCCTILGGIDKDGPSIYVIEPSGVSYVCMRYHIDRSRC
jgi:20S proteasome subunit alpha 7